LALAGLVGLLLVVPALQQMGLEDQIPYFLRLLQQAAAAVALIQMGMLEARAAAAVRGTIISTPEEQAIRRTHLHLKAVMVAMVMEIPAEVVEEERLLSAQMERPRHQEMVAQEPHRLFLAAA
jgi:hypothetical protein